MADYQSLANIAAPRMMPEAPLGAGAIAGWMYGGDVARQDDLIRKAASLAELDAQLKRQSATETMAGAPGRMDTIGLGNLEASAKLDAFKTGGGADLAAGDITRKKMEQEQGIRKALEPWFTALAGDDEQDAKVAYDKLKELMPAFGKVSYEKARSQAKAHYSGQVDSAAQAQKRELKGLDIEGKLKGIQMTNETRLAVAKATNEAKTEWEKIKGEKGSQWKMLEELYPGNPAAQYQAFIYSKIAPILQAGVNQTATTAAILPPGMPKPNIAPVVPNPTPTVGAGKAPAAAPKGTMSVDQAVEFLKSKKGDAAFEQYFNYFVNTYGKEAVKKLPADLINSNK